MDANSTAEKDVEQCRFSVKKECNISEWYVQLLVQSEMIEYHNVSGCYVLRPWCFYIWRCIQDFMRNELDACGVEEAYFPLFVTKEALEAEKTHIEGFSPEVAWVTMSGETQLANPIAIRPTSETIIYPYYSKWLQTSRSLPLKLNQWCNVVRWEFKHPTPLLRTREFLWQEGHCVFRTKEESDADVAAILEIYRKIYEEVLSIPVIKGKKSVNEAFPGALYTTTIETFIGESGKGIQCATSHSLGQCFSKIFNIVVDEKENVWQTCWGVTTRSIGVLVMIHGDNSGLVLPPRVSSIQVVLVPCGIKAGTSHEKRCEIFSTIEKYYKILKSNNIRAFVDSREGYTPGWKFYYWELKGVPLRIEIGPKDIESNSMLIVRRDKLGKRIKIEAKTFLHDVRTHLDDIQTSLFKRAKERFDSNILLVLTWGEAEAGFKARKMVLMPWCGTVECEKDIYKKTTTIDDQYSSGVKSLCIPFDQPRKIDGDLCVQCKNPAEFFAFFGRSY